MYRPGLFYILSIYFFIQGFLLPNNCQGQVLQIARIGDTLDLVERNYFQLFNKDTDFKYATWEVQDDRASFFINSNSGQVRKLTVSKKDFTDFIGLIENYEYYARSFAKFQYNNYKNLDLKLPLPVYERKGREVIVTTKSGEELEGELLHIGKNGLYLWQIDIGYDASQFSKYAVQVPFSNIEKVKVSRNFKFAKATLISFAFISAGVLAISNNSFSLHLFKTDNEYVGGLSTFIASAALGFGVGSAIDYIRAKNLTYRNLESINNQNTKAAKFLKESQMFREIPPLEILYKL